MDNARNRVFTQRKAALASAYDLAVSFWLWLGLFKWLGPTGLICFVLDQMALVIIICGVLGLWVVFLIHHFVEALHGLSLREIAAMIAELF